MLQVKMTAQKYINPTKATKKNKAIVHSGMRALD